MANELFGRKEYGEWKAYCSTEPQDNNTLPSFNNVRRAEHYFEAMALNMVVKEIMEDGMNDATVVYSNDGSSQSGVGKYIVQSLSVNGVKRVLPAFGIFTESRQSLAELIKDTMHILSVATGFKYSSKEGRRGRNRPFCCLSEICVLNFCYHTLAGENCLKRFESRAPM